MTKIKTRKNYFYVYKSRKEWKQSILRKNDK
jgi:hypothetical protein